MIIWPMEENPKRRHKDEEWQEAFRSVKLSNLTLEGAVFNERFNLVDNPEKMVQSDGFNLKMSFYSANTNNRFVKAFVQDKDVGDDEVIKMKELLLSNTLEGDKRVLVPMYKYKKRNDKYFITSIYLDSDFPVCQDNTVAQSRDVSKLRGVAMFASFE